jgi:hypothetical protein
MKPNAFPAFTEAERDELRKKIVNGIAESWGAADPAHLAQSAIDNKEWVNHPCWLATSNWSDGKGFHKLKFKGKTLYGHRAAHELWNGAVPADKHVDHLCRVRRCWNPVHLEAVTVKENTLRGANQNHLMRNGAPPPVTAVNIKTEINPRFFEEATEGEVQADNLRRDAEGRDVQRIVKIGDPLPPPPAGFEWVPYGDGYVVDGHTLEPIRTLPSPDWAMLEAVLDGTVNGFVPPQSSGAKLRYILLYVIYLIRCAWWRFMFWLDQPVSFIERLRSLYKEAVSRRQ